MVISNNGNDYRSSLLTVEEGLPRAVIISSARLESKELSLLDEELSLDVDSLSDSSAIMVACLFNFTWSGPNSFYNRIQKI